MSKIISSTEYNAWLEHPLTKALKRSFEQSITDPENQPSQYGTVTLEMYEALEDQLAKAEQRVAEWQPIDTAPKDGTVIMVAEETEPGFWEYEQSFYSHTWEFGGGSCTNNPTHWMPLPKAPSGASS